MSVTYELGYIPTLTNDMQAIVGRNYDPLMEGNIGANIEQNLGENIMTKRQANNEFVLKYKDLVGYVIARHCFLGKGENDMPNEGGLMLREDMQSAGIMALFYVAEKFENNPEKGSEVAYVYNSILHEVRSEKRKFFGESEYDTKNKFEFRRVKEGLEHDLKREPTKNEIEEKMGKKRLEIVARAFRKIVSFDDNIGQENDFDGSTLGDIIISPEVSVEEEIITRELNNTVEQYIGTLDNLDKEIFFYMSDIYGEREGKPVNTRNISEKFGIPEWEVIIRYEEIQNDLKKHLGTKEEVEGEVEAVKIPTNEINISNQKKIIENGLSLLSRQQANVIRWRFGLDGGPLRTFQDVGDENKSTRQNIQLLEKTAIMNLEIRGQTECVKILKTIIKKGGLNSKRKRMQGKEI